MDVSAWDERYASADLVWSAEPNQFLPPLVAGLSPGRALDVACGEGRNAIWLAGQGWDVTGVDFSPIAIEKARRMSEQAGVTSEFEVADLRLWEPSGSFDLVVEFYFQVPEDLRRRVHRSIAISLAPGGFYVIVGHHSDNLKHGVGGPQQPAVLFSEADVAADFEGLLEVQQSKKVHRVTDAGIALDTLFVGSAPLLSTQG